MNIDQQLCRDRGTMDFGGTSVFAIPWELRVMIAMVVGKDKGCIWIFGVFTKKMAPECIHKETGAIGYLVANVRRIHFVVGSKASVRYFFK